MEDYSAGCFWFFLKYARGLWHRSGSAAFIFFYRAAFFLRAVLLLFLNSISVRIRSEYRRQTKTIFLEKLLSASWGFFTKQKMGHVMETLMRDIDVTSKLIEDAVNIILSLSNIVVFAAMSFWISPQITFFAVILGTAVALFFQKIWRRAKAIGAELLSLSKETAQLVADHMVGAKTVKSLAVEEAVKNRGLEYFRRGENLTFRSGILSGLYGVATEPLTILCGVQFGCFCRYPYFYSANFRVFRFGPAFFPCD